MADLCPPAAGLDVDAPDAEPEFAGSFAAEPAVLERVGSPERSFPCSYAGSRFASAGSTCLMVWTSARASSFLRRSPERIHLPANKGSWSHPLMSVGTGRNMRRSSEGQLFKAAKATTPLPPSASPSKTVKYPFISGSPRITRPSSPGVIAAKAP